MNVNEAAASLQFSVFAAVIANLVAAHTYAQCELWDNMGQGLYGNFNDVNDLEIHEGNLYAAGGFYSTVPQIMGGVAKWNGAVWEPLGFSLGPAQTLASFNDELIAAGFFTSTVIGSVPMNRIARWDGKAWYTLGGGVDGGVFDLCVYKNDLYVGGLFQMAGNVPASRIARWDGESWHALGTGITGNGVLAMIVYQNELIVAGGFSHAGGIASPRMAKWDGEAWHAFPADPSSGVYGLGLHDEKLIVCGAFEEIGGIQAERIAGWNGESWNSFGPGLGLGTCWAAVSFHDQLFATGYFPDSGGIQRWTGSEWLPLGSGLVNTTGPGSGYTAISFDDKLIVGGNFYYAGGVVAGNIAQWRNYPCNDECTNAPLVGVGQYSVQTVDATTDGPEETTICIPSSSTQIYNDVWYKLLAQCTGTVTVSLCGATFDTKLAIYEMCPSGSGQVIACNEDFCGAASQVSFAVSAGTLYRIRIGSATGEMGTGSMVITCTPTSLPCPADINGDKQVNVSDLLAVINAWGACSAPCTSCNPDINNDCEVNVTDLLAIINSWGACP